MMNTRSSDKNQENSPQQLLALIILLLILVEIYHLIFGTAQAESPENLMIEEEWCILEDPELIGTEVEAEASEPDFPAITSVGKTNVKKNGVKSTGVLIQYTIPEALLRSDEDFLALMVEAEKYIGYPYVYGGSKPETGFDCSGFVCWVFRKSGVCNISRMGANGLWKKCKEVTEKELRPGDLVFFEGTMGSAVKGITHVGIYVGNNMMIHAGDPVGFADLEAESWKSKIACYGRLTKK